MLVIVSEWGAPRSLRLFGSPDAFVNIRGVPIVFLWLKMKTQGQGLGAPRVRLGEKPICQTMIAP